LLGLCASWQGSQMPADHPVRMTQGGGMNIQQHDQHVSTLREGRSTRRTFPGATGTHLPSRTGQKRDHQALHPFCSCQHSGPVNPAIDHACNLNNMLSVQLARQLLHVSLHPRSLQQEDPPHEVISFPDFQYRPFSEAGKQTLGPQAKVHRTTGSITTTSRQLPRCEN
jgi:hypothetical protein